MRIETRIVFLDMLYLKPPQYQESERLMNKKDRGILTVINLYNWSKFATLFLIFLEAEQRKDNE